MSADFSEQDEKEKDKEGRGRAGGSSGGGGAVIVQKSAATVSAEALAITKAKGANAGQIGTIVSEWRHLTGAELVKAMMDFGSGVAKASAQMLVSWSSKVSDKGYAVIMHVLQSLQQLQDPRQRAALMAQYGIRPGAGYG